MEKSLIGEEEIIQVIYSAIDELNALLPQDQRLEKSFQVVLSGEAGGLDSLGLINLIVAVEQKCQEKFGLSINLADERAMSQQNNPFATVGTLTEYISLILEEKKHG